MEFFPASGRGGVCSDLPVGRQKTFTDQASGVTMFQLLQELSRAQSLRLETLLWMDVELEETSVLLQLTAYLSTICSLPNPGAWDFLLWGPFIMMKPVNIHSDGERLTFSVIVISSP